MPKKIVPAKNVDKIFVDIRKPDFNYERHARFALLDLRRAPKLLPKKKSSFGLLWATAALVLLAAASGTIFYAGVSGGRNLIKERGQSIVDNFSASVEALGEFEPDAAIRFLENNASEIQSVNDFVRKYRGDTLAGAIGSVVPVFREAGSIIKNIAVLNLQFLELAETLRDLERSGFKYFMSNGEKLLEVLKRAQKSIRGLIGQSQNLKNSAAALKNFSSFFENINEALGGVYLKHSADLYKFDKILDRLFVLFGSPDEKHVALFFQNPAEIRPAGGFIGSYADLAVRGGQMVNLDVRDIYDPDGQLFLKVVPPKAIQTINDKWAARDANWFFDFPASARAVLYFLESSKMYSERGTIFDAAIALNINVLQTILGVTGPVNLPDYNLAINQENFLAEIQREVEAGEDKKAGEPKRILKVLTPIILDRIQNLDGETRSGLFDALKEHIAKKDIMFYAKDTELAGFLREAGIDGSVYDIPFNFWGSYLAVVNANIAGGKSDAFVRETIETLVNIDTEGGILTDLTVKREHYGDKEKDPWWRATNNNFVQVFTNPGSIVLSMSGNKAKNLGSNYDYEGNEFDFYSDLEKIELPRKFLSGLNAWTTEAFGKTVFSAWTVTPPGKTSTLALRYQTTDTGKIDISGGKKYQFIFEGQSGVRTALKLNIAAPLGYIWQESGGPFYTYESENPDGRIIINLTLAK